MSLKKFKEYVYLTIRYVEHHYVHKKKDKYDRSLYLLEAKAVLLLSSKLLDLTVFLL